MSRSKAFFKIMCDKANYPAQSIKRERILVIAKFQ